MSDLGDLRTAITGWIGKRKATVEAMETLAEVMKQEGEKLKKAKLNDGAMAGATCTTFKVVNLRRNQWVANKVAMGNSGAGIAVEVWEHKKTNSLLQKAMSTIDQEIVEYKIVMKSLSKFNSTVTGKEKLQVNPEIAEATRKIDKMIKEQTATAEAAGSESMMRLVKILMTTGGYMAKDEVKEARPVISAVLAMLLSTCDFYDAAQDALEETFLREKMKEVRSEATEIIDGIFNVFAKAFGEPPIDNPFN